MSADVRSAWPEGKGGGLLSSAQYRETLMYGYTQDPSTIQLGISKGKDAAVLELSSGGVLSSSPFPRPLSP